MKKLDLTSENLVYNNMKKAIFNLFYTLIENEK